MICFLFPPFDSFLSEPLWDFIDEVNGSRYSFIREAFPANYSFTERKNFIKMHFKAMESSAAVHLRVWKTNRRGQEGTGEGIRWKR